MKGKDFFKQEKQRLGYYKRKMIAFLKLKDYTEDQIQLYLNAYDYFCEFPYDYDGATVVKDLYDVGALDLDAMLHDYHWLIYNVASNIKYQNLSNKAYAFGMNKKGKRNDALIRYIGLTIISPFAVIYSILRRGFMKDWQKEEFKKDYKTLTHSFNGNIN